MGTAAACLIGRGRCRTSPGPGRGESGRAYDSSWYAAAGPRAIVERLDVRGEVVETSGHLRVLGDAVPCGWRVIAPETPDTLRRRGRRPRARRRPLPRIRRTVTGGGIGRKRTPPTLTFAVRAVSGGTLSDL